MQHASQPMQEVHREDVTAYADLRAYSMRCPLCGSHLALLFTNVGALIAGLESRECCGLRYTLEVARVDLVTSEAVPVVSEPFYGSLPLTDEEIVIFRARRETFRSACEQRGRVIGSGLESWWADEVLGTSDLGVVVRCPTAAESGFADGVLEYEKARHIDGLPPRERQVVRARQAGRTYREIGAEMGISATRVTQIYRQADKRLGIIVDPPRRFLRPGLPSTAT